MITTKLNTGHWIVDTETFNPEHLGFVYQITNLSNFKKYIGQKKMKSVLKRPPLKGKVNKRHCTKDTNWREYMGSSKLLLEDIATQGEHLFLFEVLQSYNDKWTLNYEEVKAIIDNDAVRNNAFYNGYVSNRLGDCPRGLKYD